MFKIFFTQMRSVMATGTSLAGKTSSSPFKRCNNQAEKMSSWQEMILNFNETNIFIAVYRQQQSLCLSQQ
jgi:hypothetical protein